jgi:hypothetical protein
LLQRYNYAIADTDVTEPVVERYIRLGTGIKAMASSKRDMYVCFLENEIRFLEDYARRKGALNISQALESLLDERKK